MSKRKAPKDIRSRVNGKVTQMPQRNRPSRRPLWYSLAYIFVWVFGITVLVTSIGLWTLPSAIGIVLLSNATFFKRHLIRLGLEPLANQFTYWGLIFVLFVMSWLIRGFSLPAN